MDATKERARTNPSVIEFLIEHLRPDPEVRHAIAEKLQRVLGWAPHTGYTELKRIARAMAGQPAGRRAAGVRTR